MRFFGQTKRGQKACINVFDYFPYFYVELPKSVYDPENSKMSKETEREFLVYFAQCLEVALYILTKSLREASFEGLANIQEEILRNSLQYIHDVQICSKYPIYGYNPEKKYFLKIEMYDPWNVRNAANILREGGVFGVPMQPYEAHISWYMHFFGDYCLGGNEHIKVADYWIRQLPKFDQGSLSRKTHYPNIFLSAESERRRMNAKNYNSEDPIPDYSFL